MLRLKKIVFCDEPSWKNRLYKDNECNKGWTNYLEDKIQFEVFSEALRVVNSSPLL